jgi:hypothetical protein
MWCDCSSLHGVYIFRTGQGAGISLLNKPGQCANLLCCLQNGTVSTGAVLGALPFANLVAAKQLTGADIIAGFRNGLTGGLSGSGRFPQASCCWVVACCCFLCVCVSIAWSCAYS